MKTTIRGLLLCATAVLAACAAAPMTEKQDEGSLAGDYLSGRFAAGERAIDVAASRYEDAAAQSASPEIANRAFEYALAAGDVRAAAGHARAMMAAPSEMGDKTAAHSESRVAAFQADDLPRLTLAVVALEEGDWDDAIEALGGPYTSSLGQSLAFMLEGWAIFARDGVDAGTAHLASPPQGAFAGFAPLHAALMYDLVGREGEAQGAYAAALNTPAAEDAAIAFAYLQEREGEKADAKDLYRRMAESRGTARRIGRMGLARLGEPLDGESAAFVKVAKKAPKRLITDAKDGAALVLSGFANAAFDQASSERAAARRAGFGDIDLYLNGPLGFARLASFLDSDQYAARYLSGAIAQTYDQPEMAEVEYAKVPPTSGYYNYAAIDRASALIALKREAEAADLLESYLKQDPLSPEVALTLSTIYADAERWNDAIAAGTAAIGAGQALSTKGEDAPESLYRYYFARGVTYNDAGRWAEAETDLNRALELSPEEPFVLNYLGYSYVERGENLDEAFSMIERALKLRPTSGAITDSLGWAHYQRGDYARAVALLEYAVQLEPGDDVITDHLGDAYWQTGRRTEARYEWRRVLEIAELPDDLRASVKAKLAGEAPAPGALSLGAQANREGI